MLSIVTGTLDRLECVKKLVKNTVEANEKLELVLVDGGSSDGTTEYIKKLNHPRINLIEEGKRSYYWDYMNKGIKASKYEWVCQWNDDLALENPWRDVLELLESENPADFYLFSWREPTGRYVIYDSPEEIVMNYGIYNKKIFREIGMYNSSYKYYCCDGDMSFRAREFGYRYQSLHHIRCNPLTDSPEQKKALWENIPQEQSNYKECLNLYRNKVIPDTVELLKDK